MPKPTITYLGQSGFLLQYQDSSLLIDPQNKSAGDRKGNIVYCTHDHPDHVGGVNVFMKQNPVAFLMGSIQVAKKFRKWTHRTVVVRSGEFVQQGPWNLSFIKEPHGFYKNKMNLGVIVRADDFTFGHVGDAVQFEGFTKAKLDVLAVPIFGGFTASPKQAIEELKKFDRPLPTIIPMHWVLRSPSGFCKRFKTEFPDATCIVPQKSTKLPI
ncbi:MAG: MBL fold metallo-hydrolase [Candidatus Hermodarchaeia archaeon]|jgi:L-ascorbate metabolism protein UlaG (beta-lactamase superfamily)